MTSAGLRVAFITTVGPAPSWGFGGSEDLWIGTATRFVEAGDRVAVGMHATPHLPKAIVNLRDRGAGLHLHCPTPSLGQRLWRRLGGSAPEPYRWLDAFQPDVVLISQNLFFDGRDAVRACRQRGLRFGVVIHIASELFWPGDDILEEFATDYGSAGVCWFVSEATRRLTEHQTGVILPNARIVRNPFRVRYEANPPWPSTAAGWRLACPARLDAVHKGQDLLMPVLAAPKWRERDLSVTLYGAGGQERYLRRLAARYQVTDRVHFGGFTSDIEAVWTDHHALILPSRCEGLPLSLVEAMLCGRLAVATTVGGNGELVINEETGFIAADPSAAAIDDALERAWARRHEWEAIGRRAREFVRERIPADPVGVFTSEVRSLARGPATAAVGIAP